MSSEDTSLSESEVLNFFTSLSNWGRWGDDDRLGTLNTITVEVRAAAAASIRTGRAVSLASFPGIDPAVQPGHAARCRGHHRSDLDG
jgi:hypothetical protein